MHRYYNFCFVLIWAVVFNGAAQENNRSLRFDLNDNGTNYIQFVGNGQVWFEASKLNPGSVVNGSYKDINTDISLRRYRMIAYGPITGRFTFVTVLGGNNINLNTGATNTIGVLDFSGEYKFADFLVLGGGKTAWHGLSRYSAAPSTTKILAVDIPVFALSTVCLNDDFGRKLGLYLKGTLGQFDYRFNMAKPYAPKFKELSETPVFDPDNQTYRTSAYLKYQFFDKESNMLPFAPGTYLGNKKVFNVGIGYDYHPDAMVRLATGQKTHEDMKLFAADVFYDIPLNKSFNTALSLYGGYFHYDFGPEYIRTIGINNSVLNCSGPDVSYNGPGNAYPMIGTGKVLYGQGGYLLSNRWNGQEKPWQMQVVGAVMHANYDKLDDPVISYETGVNLFVDPYSRFTLSYQSRPIFRESDDFEPLKTIKVSDRMGALIVQYQFVIK